LVGLAKSNVDIFVQFSHVCVSTLDLVFDLFAYACFHLSPAGVKFNKKKPFKFIKMKLLVPLVKKVEKIPLLGNSRTRSSVIKTNMDRSEPAGPTGFGAKPVKPAAPNLDLQISIFFF
jgi:hypothetical protein